MRLQPLAALAALALFLCCCCLCLAATETQTNVTSPAGEKFVVRRAGRGARRVHTTTPLGADVRVQGSDVDYLIHEQRAFRNNTTTSNKQAALEDNGGSRFKYNRRRKLERSRRQFGNTRVTPNTRNDIILGAEQNLGVFRPPNSRNVEATSTREPAGSGGSASSAGQRWLNILTEFLKESREGRELLRAQTGQLLEGVDVESGQLPRPLLLLPVPLEDQNVERPTEDGDEFHRTLMALYRAARPRAPTMPPLLFPASPRPAAAAPLPALSPAPPPARLRFDRSLLIRADLTVFYSDYTEPYTVWYDAESGSSRVDMHGGTTVLYRTVRPTGEQQRVQFVIERYGEDERRVCTRLTSTAVDADRSSPGLPDPAPFSFNGYRDTVDGRMEVWTYSLAGQAGELGAARGEALVFRHELLVARVQPDFAIPYRYRVTVDSSVLGREADRYEHRYLEVREQRPDAGRLTIDLERECDLLQRAQRLEEVDPLREYVLTRRDARKPDTDFEKFKETYDVKYEDMVEEAVRKTMLIRSTRFVESANRQGASALMGVNEFGAMLPAERQLLLGLVDEGEGGGDIVSRAARQLDPEGEVGGPPSFGRAELKPEPFPYSLEDAARIAAQLPAAFSWKRQGAITHVRNQGYCKTCWAFAVVCAVEGALFRRTGQLVPLSDQQLADCSRGPHICRRGNYVRNAYQRIRDAGILALDDYSRYKYIRPMVAQCRKDDTPVTYISGFVRVTNSSDALKVSIARHGPNVAEVDSECDGFLFFDKGVLRDQRCNPNARNHAVTAIGFGRHKTHGNYFIVKNSWGLAGNNGYVHLHADSNTAGVHTAASYPLLSEDDVPDRARLASLVTQYPDEKSLFDTGDTEAYRDFLNQQRQYLEKEAAKPQNQRPVN